MCIRDRVDSVRVVFILTIPDYTRMLLSVGIGMQKEPSISDVLAELEFLEEDIK